MLRSIHGQQQMFDRYEGGISFQADQNDEASKT